MGKYRKFSEHYRDEAVQMVIATARSIAEVSRDLGINESTLSNLTVHINGLRRRLGRTWRLNHPLFGGSLTAHPSASGATR